VGQGSATYAEKPRTKGLVWMDTPGHDIEQIMGMVAGGAQVVVFTSGRGTPTEAGEFPIICNEFCGLGLHNRIINTSYLMYAATLGNLIHA